MKKLWNSLIIYLQRIYDFHQPNKDGIELFYKIHGKEVHVVERCTNCSNIITGDLLSIPDIVSYNGKNYTVSAIDSNAFAYNNKLRKLIVGRNCHKIEEGAFDVCPNLDTVVLGNYKVLESSSFYDDPIIQFSNRLSKEDVTNLLSFLEKETTVLKNKYNKARNISKNLALCESIERSGFRLSSEEQVVLLSCTARFCANDTTIYNIDRAIKCFDALISKYNIKDFVAEKAVCLYNSYRFKESYSIIEHIENPDSRNELFINCMNREAYYYANRGDYKRAHEIIDNAILFVQKLYNDSIIQKLFISILYDSKGEFYIMENRMAEARQYRDQILKIYPSFEQEYSQSELFKTFPNSTKQALLRHLVQLIQKTSRQKYDEIIKENTDGYRTFCYEEILSIGIISLQSWLKGKTLEEVQEKNDFFIIWVVNHVIDDEIKARQSSHKFNNTLRKYEENIALSELLENGIPLLKIKKEGYNKDVLYVFLEFNDWSIYSDMSHFLETYKTALNSKDMIRIKIIPETSDNIQDIVEYKLNLTEIDFILHRNKDKMLEKFKRIYSDYKNIVPL